MRAFSGTYFGIRLVIPGHGHLDGDGGVWSLRKFRWV